MTYRPLPEATERSEPDSDGIRLQAAGGEVVVVCPAQLRGPIVQLCGACTENCPPARINASNREDAGRTPQGGRDLGNPLNDTTKVP